MGLRRRRWPRLGDWRPRQLLGEGVGPRRGCSGGLRRLDRCSPGRCRRRLVCGGWRLRPVRRRSITCGDRRLGRGCGRLRLCNLSWLRARRLILRRCCRRSGVIRVGAGLRWRLRCGGLGCRVVACRRLRPRVGGGRSHFPRRGKMEHLQGRRRLRPRRRRRPWQPAHGEQHASVDQYGDGCRHRPSAGLATGAPCAQVEQAVAGRAHAGARALAPGVQGHVGRSRRGSSVDGTASPPFAVGVGAWLGRVHGGLPDGAAGPAWDAGGRDDWCWTGRRAPNGGRARRSAAGEVTAVILPLYAARRRRRWRRRAPLPVGARMRAALASAECVTADVSGLWRPDRYCHKPRRRGAP